jgi:ACS family hexuronate transporter-like MFS transporter
LWLLFYRTPAASGAADSSLPIDSTRAQRPSPSSERLGSAWAELFRSRAIWGVAITRIFGDPVWFFYLFWLPKYFNDAKHMSLSSIGAFAWIPYAAQILGGLFGGWLADRLIRRGLPPVQARLRVMLYAMPVLSCGVLSVLTDSLPLVMLTVSIGSFALQGWGICVETLPSDIFPAERVAAGVGLCGMLGTRGGVVFTAATGYVVQHYSYSPIWVASALMFPIGWLVGWTLLRRNPLYLSGAAETHAPTGAAAATA